MNSLVLVITAIFVTFFVCWVAIRTVLALTVRITAPITIREMPTREHFEKRFLSEFKTYERIILSLNTFLSVFFLGANRERVLTSLLSITKIPQRIDECVSGYLQISDSFEKTSYLIRKSKINEKHTLIGRIVKSSVNKKVYEHMTQKLGETV